MHNSNKNSFYKLSNIALLLIVISVIVRFTLPLRDGDIWWHMMYGRYFLENSTLIIDHTLFSWTPTENDFLYCSWLPEIILYLFYTIGGLPALFLIRYSSFLIFILLFWSNAKKHMVINNPITWLVCLLTIHLSFVGTFIKPEIFSFIFMTIFSWNWWKIKNIEDSNWKRCYIFPFVMLLWVNSHGAFVFGVIFLVIIGISELINFKIGISAISVDKRKHLYIALILSAIVLLLTPYGYSYLLHVFKFFLPTEENIGYINTNQAYLSPFDIKSKGLGNVLLGNVSVVILAFLMLCNVRSKKMDISDILTNIFFIYIFTTYLRTTYFWSPVLAFSSLHLIEGMSIIKWSNLSFIIIYRIVIPSAFLLVFLAMMYQPLFMPIAYGWIGWGICENTPVEEARFIKKNYSGYNIGNTFAQGSYLLWELYPGSRVSIDSRQFPYKKLYADQQRFISGEKVEEFLTKYPAKIWCIDLEMKNLLDWFIASKEWNLVFFGMSSAVFVNQKEVVPGATSYQVGNGLLAFKNPFTALNMLTICFSLQDIKNAEVVVNRIETIFTTRTRKKFVEESRQFYEGMLAYKRHDFNKAITFFRPAWQRFRNTTLPSNALIFLADQAWQQEQGEEAMQLSEEAFRIERNIYTQYNLAITLWYNHTRKNEESSQLEWDWRELFTHFLYSVPRNTDTYPIIRQSEQILRGEYQGKPPLLTPPLPSRL